MKQETVKHHPGSCGARCNNCELGAPILGWRKSITGKEHMAEHRSEYVPGCFYCEDCPPCPACGGERGFCKLNCLCGGCLA